ncbi:hypothetical protein HDV02_000264 [Globomyces sp. JEL0801]|nr:hypothetical protein HDV02_000264 [Globomyces sp. JEL0801]
MGLKRSRSSDMDIDLPPSKRHYYSADKPLFNADSNGINDMKPLSTALPGLDTKKATTLRNTPVVSNAPIGKKSADIEKGTTGTKKTINGLFTPEIGTPECVDQKQETGCDTPNLGYDTPKSVGNGVDMNEVSASLTNMIEFVNSTEFKKFDPTLVNELTEKIPQADLALYKNSVEYWLSDMKREDRIMELRSDQYLEMKFSGPVAISRWALIDWLREVSVEHRLMKGTFHSAIQYYDIFLSKETIDESHYQLLIVACLLVAVKVNVTNLFAKFEKEATRFTLDTLIEFMWDENEPNEVNEKQMELGKMFLLKYEYKLMKIMNWDLLLPTPLDFLQHALQFATFVEPPTYYEDLPNELVESRDRCTTIQHQRYCTMQFSHAVTILDQSVLDYRSLSFPPSVLAATAFYKHISTHTLSVPVEKLLLTATGYTVNDLSDCLQFMEVYHPENVEEILTTECMQKTIKNYSSFLNENLLDQDFKLQQHQITSLRSVKEYDELLQRNAQLLGNDHQSSYWCFSPM